MDVLALAAGLLKLVNLLIGYFNDKQLIDAGKAENAVASMAAVNAEVEKSRAAIAAIHASPAWAQRLQQLANRDK